MADKGSIDDLIRRGRLPELIFDDTPADPNTDEQKEEPAAEAPLMEMPPDEFFKKEQKEQE